MIEVELPPLETKIRAFKFYMATRCLIGALREEGKDSTMEFELLMLPPASAAFLYSLLTKGDDDNAETVQR